MTTETPNTLFPGRPNYTGPTQGMFGLLHHEVLFESSHNVAERVAYVKANKPPHEVAVRLHNMIYLGACEAANTQDTLLADYLAKRDALDADYWAKRVPLDADYLAKRDALIADYEAKVAPLYAEILGYIRAQIPDCAWDETNKTLVFPKT